MIVDFHCHTTASDGALTPDELVARASRNGVEQLAITDHDTLGAYRNLVPGDGMRLIPGIELSCQWQKRGIHIVGLNVDMASDAMAEALAHQSSARRERADMIAAKLEKYGVESPLSGAQAIADGATLGRPHFARYLVQCGFVKSEKEAFKKYLGSGKPCDIKVCWPETQQVIEWIRGAGGTAVLAHPGKYKLTRSRLISYVEEFQRWGGQGMEILSGPARPDETKLYSTICEKFGLHESLGSDFHSPQQRWLDLGVQSSALFLRKPVWELWS